MILVTGAAGQVGCSILHALRNMGKDVRAFVHREEHREKVINAGAKEVFAGDMNLEADLAAAFQGIDTVYYICSAQNPDEDEIGRKMIEIARTKKDLYFVYHSVLHSLLEEMPHHRKKQTVEKMLVESGLEYAILQPAVFMQMLMPAVFSVKEGGPAPQKFFRSDDTGMNFIDLDDFAEAAARIITNRGYAYGTYELAGSENISRTNLEEALSNVAGREVKTVFLEDPVFLKNAGIAPDTYRATTMLTMFRHYNTHSFTGNSMVFETIVGKKPKSLYEFFSIHL